MLCIYLGLPIVKPLSILSSEMKHSEMACRFDGFLYTGLVPRILTYDYNFECCLPMLQSDVDHDGFRTTDPEKVNEVKLDGSEKFERL